MILLSLFIVILLERSHSLLGIWHYTHYYQMYAEKLTAKISLDDAPKANQNTVLWILLPVAAVALVQSWLGNSLFGLTFAVFVLFVCFGCPQYRSCYKQYLEAANRGDLEACDLYANELGLRRCQQGMPQESVGQTLIWLNYRYYLAVIFWFAVLGPCGAVLYVFARHLADQTCQNENQQAVSEVSQRFMLVLDFIPSRIAGFAYLFVGNFSQALGIWLQDLIKLEIGAREFVTRVAVAAEEVDAPEHDCITEPCLLVKLAKRAVLFSVALIAVLNLMGIIN
ncbi:regulatory signaling modulator protein AmpE [Saccharobesus litoralis]|uniref:Regulatory signaling modulator protein AmpE n=1 Tax=Saccharobesus litoralis TaxID=2172099 RepID=A0A2S0VWW5_9ALTE|nr:beta-lactamase regulator AmpE [Saccharobesus litoralis]AWB68711.1 regulatory signaling modulator protein AmpE [Saccharobesus litoralis]